MDTLRINTVEVSPFVQNCRILWSLGKESALVIDPGGDVPLIESFLNKNNLSCSAIWLTHSHLDHCGGVAKLLERYDVPLIGHEAEKEHRERVSQICQMYGVPPGLMDNCPEPSMYIRGGETLEFMGYSFEVRYTPGHSPGHVCFYQKETGTLIAGDALFAGSIGRTDLPGGNHQELINSIRSQLFTLPDNTVVMPGHGPDTTIGHEKRTNPFLQ